MEELQSPNMMRVVGLVFSTVGMLLLAKVITSHTYLASNEADRNELNANRRYVGVWFFLPIVVAGFQLQLLAEFVPTIPMSIAIVSFLGLGLWMLFYVLIEELLAERMLDKRKESEARRGRETPAARHDLKVHSQEPLSARVA